MDILPTKTDSFKAHRVLYIRIPSEEDYYHLDQCFIPNGNWDIVYTGPAAHYEDLDGGYSTFVNNSRFNKNQTFSHLVVLKETLSYRDYVNGFFSSYDNTLLNDLPTEEPVLHESMTFSRLNYNTEKRLNRWQITLKRIKKWLGIDVPLCPLFNITHRSPADLQPVKRTSIHSLHPIR